jgi:hypothetical protein
MPPASTDEACAGGCLCRPPAQRLSVLAGANAARQRPIFPISICPLNSPVFIIIGICPLNSPVYIIICIYRPNSPEFIIIFILTAKFKYVYQPHNPN